jgi:hypothetical protein
MDLDTDDDRHDAGFSGGDAELAPARGEDPDLSRCGGCGCPFVQPIDWSVAGSTHWRVTLRCPNCEWTGTGVFGQETVDRFDRELDRGTRALQTVLARVSRACMEADVEQFTRALASDLILPSDF